MNCKELREKSWATLKPKWDVFAPAELLFSIFNAAAGTIPFGSILTIGSINLSASEMSLKVINNEKCEIKDIFNGFKSFTKSLLLNLLSTLYIILWSLLLIVPGIIKSLGYSMSYFILYENSNLEASEVLKRSEVMMKGHKWELFKLDLSFLGWFLLSILTFGILFFWTIPAYRVATAYFYNEIKGEVESIEVNSEVI